MQFETNAEDVFASAISDHLDVVRQMLQQQDVFESIGSAMSASIRQGGKVLWCGNGGSAADSQHLAAELVGRFRRERSGLASIALTTDTSILTAVANDYGYDAVFSRQVEALGKPGDVLVGISTSGNSSNVVTAFGQARSSGMITIAFTGADGGKLSAAADYLFAVNSRDTARIQEAHILAGHMLCDWIELDVVRETAASSQPERIPVQ